MRNEGALEYCDRPTRGGLGGEKPGRKKKRWRERRTDADWQWLPQKPSGKTVDNGYV